MLWRVSPHCKRRYMGVRLHHSYMVTRKSIAVEEFGKRGWFRPWAEQGSHVMYSVGGLGWWLGVQKWGFQGAEGGCGTLLVLCS